MATNLSSESNLSTGSRHSSQRSDSHAPQLTLPKGGGAIRGIGEKFAANPVTGTASLGIPVFASPGRAGFGPKLSLSYDSGAGNGPFGFGWALDLPAITRKTDKGLPRYASNPADVFLLSGVEDLVPVLVDAGNGLRPYAQNRDLWGRTYRVERYRPRIESLFARIERWTNTLDRSDVFWRSISRDNTTTWYGRTAESRIADPTDASRIFSWLMCKSHDDKGNVMACTYKPEDSLGINRLALHERNRTEASRSANRYPKRITYGNRVPYFFDPALPQPPIHPDDWLFELVFDYGEHDTDVPTPDERTAWPARLDPFSRYRGGFEVRTYRLCQRVLMFHRFAELGEAPCLVRSTDFTYSFEVDPTQASNPVFSFLVSATHTGYTRDSDGSLVARSLPQVEFEYSKPVIQSAVHEIDAASLENLPAGLDPAHVDWLDLDGEGVSGALTQQGGAWMYKRSLGLASPESSGSVRLGAIERLPLQPAMVAAAGPTFLDLAGDGQLDMVGLDRRAPGFYERTSESWESFTSFQSLPNIDWQDPNLRFVDLTGDGHTDVLITDHDALCWHASLAEAGFGPAERLFNAVNEEQGPRVVFADGTESIQLADMDGDGLTDIVRVRNGEVCYWPNLGYGRFGAKVAMDNAPWFDAPDRFDHRRIRLGDIDGTGCIDILYLAEEGVAVYFNQSGNAWSARATVPAFPAVDSLASVQMSDLMGNGTACLVWSSVLPGDARAPLRYVDLMGGQKPHLLVKAVNNLGAETHVTYAPSTRFYLADRAAGRPWITRLPFPVHVVERVETLDRISGNRFVTRYAYHHGYFDGTEREFRGFGMVEQYDTEEIAALSALETVAPSTNNSPESHVPPVLTRSWFHTGFHAGRGRVSDFFAGLLDADDTGEYYREPGLSDADARLLLLDDTMLPPGLTHQEEREACRALKGSMLRQEVYALDGTDCEAHPYLVTEQNFSVRLLQPRAGNAHAVFFAHPREALKYHYEREVATSLAGRADPRVSHALTLSVDDFGNVLRSATIGYGRRTSDPDLTAADQARQADILATLAENSFTNTIDLDDQHRTPLSSETRAYELTGLQVTGSSARRPQSARSTSGTLVRYGFDEVFRAFDAAASIPYEQRADPAELQKRLIDHVRTQYRPDDLGASEGHLTALLPLNVLEPHAVAGEAYTLALTPGLIAQVFGDRVTAGVLAGEGGYVDVAEDGSWWMPAGRMFLSVEAGDTPERELAAALAHFFTPRRFRDPFGNETTITADGYDLLIAETRDALANTVSAVNDYRVLQPRLVTDPNGSQSEVAFDALGLVVGTAVMGKPGEDLGDTLANFETDPAEGEVIAHLTNPLANPSALLQGATIRLVYDLYAYHRTRFEAQPAPVVASGLARVTHQSDLADDQESEVRVSATYSDGFAREIQKKLQAEPGPLDAGGPIVSPRWVGSGWTVFNNKGQPVRQFEPFFTDTHRFEPDVRRGVSPILCYDPVGRVVATLNPNHTWQKVVFDAWRQETWDVNDTVVLVANPADDVDVGGYLGRLRSAAYLPTWHAQRIAGDLGPHEQTAAARAAVHGSTPIVAHADSLGRAFLTVVHNVFKRSDSPPEEPREERFQRTKVVLDIEGNQREVIDALERVVMRYDYDLTGNQIHSASMEAGERWVLNDVSGKPLRTWDSRGHAFRTDYDALRRPLGRFVIGGDPVRSDPRVLGREVQFERIEYGEVSAAAVALNLRTRVWKVHDGAGRLTNEAYDFKGNPLRVTRQLAIDYKGALDWSSHVDLEVGLYTTSTSFDAFNRPVTVTSPDGSVIRRTYNEADLLERLDANLRGEMNAGALIWTPFVTGVTYNAKGQRERIEYGNGVTTNYAYDPLTFALVGLVTARDPGVFPDDCPAAPPAGWPGCRLQSLHYTYDPAGNITHIQDDAQQTIFFRNRRVDPCCDYVYDATYQLIEAGGREHLGQIGGVPSASAPPDAFNTFHTGLLHPDDGLAMGRYVESYVYDAAGNILSMQHRGSDPAHPGWTRTYAYAEPSLNELGVFSNGLTSTQVGSGIVERYGYDAHGSMTAMPHLPVMEWTYLDRLRASSTQVVVDGAPETTYYVYDAEGRRVRKVTERQAAAGAPARKHQRVYIGGFESYREYDATGNGITLERETLHLVDDEQRIAIVESRTTGNDDSPPRLLRYQVATQLGSVGVEVDQSGSIISYEEYFAYGSTSYHAVSASIGAGAKRYRYTARERDEETGLSYHSARYYASWLGRWTKTDPIGIAGGANVYAYARNSPLVLVDPSGMSGRRPPPRAAMPPSVIVEAEPPPIPTSRYVPRSATYENLRAREGDWYREPTQTFIRGVGSSSSGASAREQSFQRVQSEYTETLIAGVRAAVETPGRLSGAQRMQLFEYTQWGLETSFLATTLSGQRLPPSVLTANAYMARFTEYRGQGGTENFIGWLGQQVPPGTGGPHLLETVVLRNGVPVMAGRVASGAQGQHSITTWSDQYWTHTEAQFVRENWSLMRQGDIVVMVGQLPPCAGCRGTMNHVDAEVGVEFRYRMVGSTGYWESAPVPGSTRVVNNLSATPPSSQNPAVMPYFPGLVGALYAWAFGADTSEQVAVPPRDPNAPVVTNPR